VERKEVFRERAGGRCIDIVSEVEDVVEEFIREEGKSIDLRGGERRSTSVHRGSRRLLATLLGFIAPFDTSPEFS